MNIETGGSLPPDKCAAFKGACAGPALPSSPLLTAGLDCTELNAGPLT